MTGDGVEIITALGGNDVITTGTGAKTIDAGEGLNIINTGNVVGGITTITTGSGDDQITVADGPTTIDGGDGQNVVTTGNVLTGTTMITVGTGDDRITVGDGDKFVIAGAGDNVIRLGDGTSTVTALGGDDDIQTGNDSDIILAGDGLNVIASFGGRDFVQTGVDVDLIEAGTGNDIVLAGMSDDRVLGGEGNDLIVGDQGDDALFGNAGNDSIWGGLPVEAIATWTIGTFTTASPPDWGTIESTFAWHTTNFDLSNQAAFTEPLGWQGASDESIAQGRPAYSLPLLVVPNMLTNFSVDGVNASSAPNANDGDGSDMIEGGDGSDWLFGGGDADAIDGGADTDFIDGGAANDRLLGGIGLTLGDGGDDVIRGGLNDDILRGGDGLDLLFGDQGEDLLFGDTGAADGSQVGQVLFGGTDKDTLYAFANYDATLEVTLLGDHLLGESGEDLLYGNLRQDLLDGGNDGDFLHGDYLDGPLYARNVNAGSLGGGDVILGGFGQDQLFGGGGPDRLLGGNDGDWLQGMDGFDVLIGGNGIDMLTLDVDNRYTQTGGDSLHGHLAVEVTPGVWQDNAVGDAWTDILLVEGDANTDADGNTLFHDDIILEDIGALGSRQIQVTYQSGSARHATTGQLINPVGGPGNAPVTLEPSVEQIQIAGLMGDDVISVQGLREADETPRANAVSYAAMVGGGPGNDILIGSPGDDRLDGGPGSDRVYGLAGNDRLWGDFFNGNAAFDQDELYAGEGFDDVIGGAGGNVLAAWSFDPTVDYALPANYTASDLRNTLMQLTPFSQKPTGDFGVFTDINDNPSSDPAAGSREDTGLNRMLGSAGSLPDTLYGGTGLDFLYGNGGGGSVGDTIYTASGKLFGEGDNPYEEDDAWKEYAKQTDAVWYLGPNVGTTNSADTINVGYNDDTSSTLYGRHYVEVNNNIWIWTDFSPVGEKENTSGGQPGALSGDEQISASESFFDGEGIRYEYDFATGAGARHSIRYRGCQWFRVGDRNCGHSHPARRRIPGDPR